MGKDNHYSTISNLENTGYFWILFNFIRDNSNNSHTVRISRISVIFGD
jgi:hypothetical protein